MTTCRCGVVNDVRSLTCRACEAIIRSPANCRDESFIVGQTIFFRREATGILEKGVISEFLAGVAVDGLTSSSMQARVQYITVNYFEIHCIDNLCADDKLDGFITKLRKKSEIHSHLLSVDDPYVFYSNKKSLSPPARTMGKTKRISSSYDDSSISSKSKESSKHLLGQGSIAKSAKLTSSPQSFSVSAAPRHNLIPSEFFSSGESNSRQSANQTSDSNIDNSQSHAREWHLSNRDLCAICGQSGDIVCCDYCPRSFHVSCMDVSHRPHSNASSSIDTSPWKCQKCLITPYTKELWDIDLESKECYNYLSTFVIPRKKGKSLYFPTVGEFLHYAEIALPQDSIRKLAKCMSHICMDKASSKDIMAMLSSPLFETSERSLQSATSSAAASSHHSYSHNDIIPSHFRADKVLGEELFLQTYQELLNGGGLLGQCLKPSIIRAYQLCECGEKRWFRCFCHQCGCFFDHNSRTETTDDDHQMSKRSHAGKSYRKAATTHNDDQEYEIELEENCMAAAVRGIVFISIIRILSVCLLACLLTCFVCCYINYHCCRIMFCECMYVCRP